MDDLLTAREFALADGIEERYVRRWAANGEVDGVRKIGRAWVATRQAWERAAATERKPGRKRKGDADAPRKT